MKKIYFSFAVLFTCAALFAAAPKNSSYKSILRFGENISVGAQDVVDGPVTAFGGDIEVAGQVNGPVTAFGGNILLKTGAAVSGPAMAFGGKTTSEAGVKIDGPLLELPASPLKAKDAKQAVFGFLGALAGTLGGLFVAFKLLTSIGWIALAAILTVVFPDAFENSANTLTSKFLRCGLIGILFWPCLFILAGLFLISIVGIPLIPPLVMVTMLTWLWSFTTVSVALGQKLSSGKWSPLKTVLLGAILLKAITWIPFGGLISFLATALLGVGAVVTTRFGTRSV